MAKLWRERFCKLDTLSFSGTSSHCIILATSFWKVRDVFWLSRLMHNKILASALYKKHGSQEMAISSHCQQILLATLWCVLCTRLCMFLRVILSFAKNGWVVTKNTKHQFPPSERECKMFEKGIIIFTPESIIELFCFWGFALADFFLPFSYLALMDLKWK